MADSIFNFDFSDEGGVEDINLDDIIPGVETPEDIIIPDPAPTPTPAKPITAPKVDAEEEEELIDLDDLPDDGFSKDIKADPAKVETPTETDPSKIEVPSSSPFSSLAKLFQERGVISDLEGFDKTSTVEDFMDTLQAKLQNGVTSEMTEEQRKYYEAVKAGVPTDWYHDKTTILNRLNSVKEDQLIADSDQAKQVRYNLIYNDFVSKGFEADEAKQMAIDQFQLGRDKELSKKAIASAKLKIQEEINLEVSTKQAEQEAAVKQKETVQAELKKRIYESIELLPGLKLTQIAKDKVYKTATTIVAYDEENRPLTAMFKALKDNPVETQAVMSYLWSMTDGGKNINNLMSKASSKVAKEVEDMIISGSLLGNKTSPGEMITPGANAGLIASLRAAGIGESQN